uniref:Cytochrome P450 n=1 Tax=Timema douglasi TaxID=61478 RepID=A0A7R8ZAS6_TIMDO|nr:unnamed protein product [Timema douglasi]
MLAGFETTASGSSFSLMLLAFHPDIQDRAFQELVDIFGNNKKQLETFEDLKEMTYLEQIIMETLRLYPSIPITMRDVEEEITIKNYIIPADCNIMINLLVIHRNPKYFMNPDKFDPDHCGETKTKTPMSVRFHLYLLAPVVTSSTGRCTEYTTPVEALSKQKGDKRVGGSRNVGPFEYLASTHIGGHVG